MTWFERARAQIREDLVEERECADTKDIHADHLELELDVIRTIRAKLKTLAPHTRKRVWFYVDDLVKEGLGD